MRGFTLVELSLAMGFLSVLLLAISMLTLQISSIYNKGLTLRAVNESGQLLSSEVQRTLNQADPGNTTFIPSDAMPVPNNTGGRLCAGTTVYAWNYAGKFDDPSASSFNSLDGNSIVRFIKFSAPIDEYCEDTDTATAGIQYKPLPPKDTVTRLLAEGGNADLVIRSFEFVPTSISTNSGQQTIYRVSFILGTNNNDLITDDMCDISKGSKVDDEYCAVNKFTFTSRAGRIYGN